MDSGNIIPLLVAVITGGIGVEIVRTLIASIQGRMKRQRDVWEKLDRERALRREFAEVLHATRAIALAHGIPLKDLPAVPEDD